jgi:hypothetical protein
MIHKGAKGAQRITQYHKAIPKPFRTIPFWNHTLYSREDPRLLAIASSAMMIVVHFAKFSSLYQGVVISSLTGRLEKPPFYHFLHYLWCMAQRSVHTITKVYYGSYARLFFGSRGTIAMLRFPGVVGGTTTPLPSCGPEWMTLPLPTHLSKAYFSQHP